MNTKFAVGFVIYQPTKAFTERLKLLSGVEHQIYLYDNSPIDGKAREIARTAKNICYLTCGKNVGLGIGISALCAQAYYDSQPALLFFDQDTVFDHRTLEFIGDFYEKNSGLFAQYSAVVFNGENIDQQHPANDSLLRDVLLARSSGSLFILENVKACNWHNENYFVDCVDYEFCLRSKRAGFKIAECAVTPGFDHQSEQPDQKFCLFGRTLMLRRYPAARVCDTFGASIRLIVAAIKCAELWFAFIIVRSLSIYAAAQLLARALLALNKFNKPGG